ncbi:MAG: hypothetical protein K8T20_08945 [Planctomycetes bacterium]|nr:hypothetical protein [Planctomycetota bacterium]
MRTAAVMAFLMGLAMSAGADWYTATLTSAADSLGVEVELDKVHIESSIGIFDIDGAKIRRLEAGKDRQAMKLADGTELTGKIVIKSMKVRSSWLGSFELPDKIQFVLDIKGPAPVAGEVPPERPPAGKPIVRLETTDNDHVQGTLDFEMLEIKSVLGTFKVRMEDVGRITFDNSRIMVWVKGDLRLGGTTPQAKWPVLTENLGRIEVALEKMRDLNRVNSPENNPAGTVKKPLPMPANALRRLSSTRALSCFHVSQDRKTLHALDLSGPKLLVFSLESLTLQSEFPLPAGTTSLCFDFAGKTAASCARDVVSMIEPETGKVTRSFRVELALHDAVPVGPDLLLASMDQEGMAAIVPSKQAIVRRFNGERAGAFRFHPDGHRLYASELTVHVPDNATAESLGIVRRRTAFNATFSVFSDDGLMAVTTEGAVLLPGKSDLADLKEIGRVEPHWGALFSGDKLLVFTFAGFMKTYDVKTFQITGSTALDFVAGFAVADPAGKVLTLYGKTAKTEGCPNSIPYDRTLPPGDFVQIPAPE